MNTQITYSYLNIFSSMNIPLLVNIPNWHMYYVIFMKQKCMTISFNGGYMSFPLPGDLMITSLGLMYTRIKTLFTVSIYVWHVVIRIVDFLLFKVLSRKSWHVDNSRTPVYAGEKATHTIKTPHGTCKWY